MHLCRGLMASYIFDTSLQFINLDATLMARCTYVMLIITGNLTEKRN